MKKLILLLTAFTFVFTSCSSDDDNTPSQDPLIGAWNYYKYFENGVEEPLDPCETDETFVVLADGTFSAEYFDEVTVGSCESAGAFNGTWENLGSGTYALTSSGFTDEEDVTFDGNTFYFEDTYDNGTPGDTSDDIVYRDVYIRQ